VKQMGFSELIEIENKIMHSLAISDYRVNIYQISDVIYSIGKVINKLVQYECISTDKFLPTIHGKKLNILGRMQGYTSNNSDPFYMGLSIIQAGIKSPQNKHKTNRLSYSVQKCTKMLCMTADMANTRISFVSFNDDVFLKLQGHCSLVLKESSQNNIYFKGNFKLLIKKHHPLRPSVDIYKMIIKSSCSKLPYHNSGIVHCDYSDIHRIQNSEFWA